MCDHSMSIYGWESQGFVPPPDAMGLRVSCPLPPDAVGPRDQRAPLPMHLLLPAPDTQGGKGRSVAVTTRAHPRPLFEESARGHETLFHYIQLRIARAWMICMGHITQVYPPPRFERRA